MPELPEIEVTRAGISHHLCSNTITRAILHSSNLRWPISPEIVSLLQYQTIHSVERRGKYLLFNCKDGVLLIHLGMTGQLRLVSTNCQPGKHDHLDIVFTDGVVLRLNDVRRFSSVVWVGSNPHTHKLLSAIGPDPLAEDFNDNYLYQKIRGRKLSIKQFLMDHKMVAGLGNIYANEVLFHAGIRPSIPAGRLSKVRCKKLIAAIKSVLTTSINAGGTMLDFRDGTEKLGSFPHMLEVYRRGGRPCRKCTTPIQYERLGRRSIYFCRHCQR